MTEATQYTNTDDAAEVTFTGTADNVLTGTGSQTDFYRLIIDKGSDQTYILDIDVSNFELWGPTDLANANETDPNPTINKALWIKNGTCKLESGITIPELSSGNGDFFMNTISWLAEEENLIAIRAKSRKAQPLILTPRQSVATFFIPVVVIPLAWFMAGIVLYIFRKRTATA